MKNLQTENNQYKTLNEKLMDRIEMLNAFVEKEASAQQYMYNYPPKADESLVKKGNLDKKSDNEGAKIKK